MLLTALSASIITIAIIDTGIDLKHPDLKNNIWTNPGESGLDQNGRDKSKNNIDDDKNGYVDDIHGWDFTSNSSNISDNHGHGTHIAGIIYNNIKRLKNLKSNVRFIILKYYDPNLHIQDSAQLVAKSIEYATKMGAQIINYSGGGSSPSAQEYRAIKNAEKNNILLIAAAGNESTHLLHSNFYPATYDLSNIIAVSAIDENHDLLPSSNYSSKKILLSAPGKDIYSTLPGNRYGIQTGTSQATAYATAATAVILSKGIKNMESIKNKLIEVSLFSAKLWKQTKTSSFIDINLAHSSYDLLQNSFGQNIMYTGRENEFIVP